MATIFQRTTAKMQGPEKEFQRAIIEYLRIRFGPRFWHVKTLGGLGQRRGIPDFLICLDGYFVALEIKSPTGKGRISNEQAYELSAIKEAGGLTAVVASWEDLENVLAGFGWEESSPGAPRLPGI